MSKNTLTYSSTDADHPYNVELGPLHTEPRYCVLGGLHPIGDYFVADFDPSVMAVIEETGTAQVYVDNIYVAFVMENNDGDLQMWRRWGDFDACILQFVDSPDGWESALAFATPGSRDDVSHLAA